MIHKLRSRHRIIWIPIIALVVFLVIIGGEGERLLVPLNETLPGVSKKVEILQLIEDASVVWEKEDLEATVSRNTDQELVLSIITNVYVNKPDLLLYMNRIGGRSVTRESVLLGSFTQNEQQNFVLPDSSFTDGSVFVLYSLPKKEIVDIATVSVHGGGE